MKKVPASVSLPLHRVEVVEAGGHARREWQKCEIGENLRFDPAGLAAYCLADWDERVFDAFVLASAIQFCDHTKARPSMGWGRGFSLRVPVHDPVLWNSTRVLKALTSALNILTGDRWEIEFTARRQKASSPKQGHFNMPDGARVIMPFSDGLDSLAVSGLMEQQHRHKLIRVRLGSKALNNSQKARLETPFAVVPYRIRFGARGSVETSARSRGFRFALLSAVAAFLSQAKQIIVSESGQGAIGPVLVPVGQAYEDYRNHPVFTRHMEIFVSSLFSHEVEYTYPRIWSSKAETVADFIAAYPDSESWLRTRSCWQGQRQASVSGHMRQCGVCAACMLRRMTVHAIGKSEDRETYVWEDLTAPTFESGAAAKFNIGKPKGAMFEYAIAGTLHLDHLAGILQSPINRVQLEHQAFQLSESLNLPIEETRKNMSRLLTQHQNEWRNYVQSLGPSSFVARWAQEGA